MRRRAIPQRARGFTLLEVLVSIGILAMVTVIGILVSPPTALLLWGQARQYSRDVPSIGRLIAEWSAGLVFSYAAFAFDCMLAAVARAATTPVTSEWFTWTAGNPLVAFIVILGWCLFCCLRENSDHPWQRMLLWLGGLGGALPLFAWIVGAAMMALVGGMHCCG